MISRMLMMCANAGINAYASTSCYLSTNQINHATNGLLISDNNNFAYFSAIGIHLYSRNIATGVLTFVSTTTFNNNNAVGLYDSNMVITNDGLYLFSLSINLSGNTYTHYLNKFTRNNSTGAITFDSQTLLNSQGVSLKFNADKTKLYLATKTEYLRYSVASGILTLDWTADLDFIESNNFHNMKIGSFIITNTESYSVLLCSSDFNLNPSFPYTSGYKNTPFFKGINNADGTSLAFGNVPSSFFDITLDYGGDSSLSKSPIGNFIVFLDMALENNILKIGSQVAAVENNGDINTVEVYYGNNFNQGYPNVFDFTGKTLFSGAANGDSAKFNTSTGHITYFESALNIDLRLVISKDNKFIYGLNNNNEYYLYSFGIACILPRTVCVTDTQGFVDGLYTETNWHTYNNGSVFSLNIGNKLFVSVGSSPNVTWGLAEGTNYLDRYQWLYYSEEAPTSIRTPPVTGWVLGTSGVPVIPTVTIGDC